MSATASTAKHKAKKSKRRADSSGSTTEEVLDLTQLSASNSPEKKAKSPAKTKKRAKKSASTAIPRGEVNAWPGIAELAEKTGIRSVTTVDPGTRNLAIIRMEFLPSVGITHTHVLDLEKVCAKYDAESDEQRGLTPGVRLNHATVTSGRSDYPKDSKLYALARYVREQARDNGCFDSDMLLVEEQSFDRLMARVEAIIVTTFNAIKPPVRVLDGVSGGALPAGQVVTAAAVKSAYKPIFPTERVSSAKSSANTDNKSASFYPRAGRRPFGIGDVHSDKAKEAQRRLHKRNAILYGSMIVPADRFAELVPDANLTDEDRLRLTKRKMDDLYDTLWMCAYFINSFMFQIFKIKRRGVSRALPAFQALPTRTNSVFEEITELCIALSSRNEDVHTLMEALMQKELPKDAFDL